LVIALAPGGQKYLDRVKSMRIRLANELEAVINEYGPKAFEDFNEVRLLYFITNGYLTIVYRVESLFLWQVSLHLLHKVFGIGNPGTHRADS
jgi:hypothetical protein